MSDAVVDRLRRALPAIGGLTLFAIALGVLENRMEFGLTGKRAVVTGSTAGIGFAIAEALSREGAGVVVNSLLKRFATPDEVAAVVAFVASARSAAINGAALRAEGGVIRSIL